MWKAFGATSIPSNSIRFSSVDVEHQANNVNDILGGFVEGIDDITGLF